MLTRLLLLQAHMVAMMGMTAPEPGEDMPVMMTVAVEMTVLRAAEVAVEEAAMMVAALAGPTTIAVEAVEEVGMTVAVLAGLTMIVMAVEEAGVMVAALAGRMTTETIAATTEEITAETIVETIVETTAATTAATTVATTEETTAETIGATEVGTMIIKENQVMVTIRPGCRVRKQGSPHAKGGFKQPHPASTQMMICLQMFQVAVFQVLEFS